MSILGYYDYYAGTNETPKWMRNERYEYCEPYDRDEMMVKPAKRKNMLTNAFFAALSAIK